MRPRSISTPARSRACAPRAARRSSKVCTGRRARFATAGIVLAVAGLLWFSAPNGNPMQASLGDIELLAADEHPDFFTELEFYEWLEGSEDAV